MNAGDHQRAGEYLGWSADEVAKRVHATGLRLGAVLAHAVREGVAPHRAADVARARIAAPGAGARGCSELGHGLISWARRMPPCCVVWSALPRMDLAAPDMEVRVTSERMAVRLELDGLDEAARQDRGGEDASLHRRRGQGGGSTGRRALG